MHETIAVVLSSKNEVELRKLLLKLTEIGVSKTPIVETEGDYAGQLMAIGVWPTNTDIRRVFNGYQLFMGID